MSTPFKVACLQLNSTRDPAPNIDIIAFGAEGSMLRLDFAQFFLGTEVDGAEALAIAPQAFEIGFDRAHLRQRLAGIDAGQVRDLCGFDLEHLVNFVCHVGEPTLAAFEPLVGTRRILARRSHRLECAARVAIGLGQRVLALGEVIGGCAPFCLRSLDLADQGATLLFEDAGRILELGALLLRLVEARFEAGDLRNRDG